MFSSKPFDRFIGFQSIYKNAGSIVKKRITKEDNFTYLFGSLVFLLFTGAYSAQFSSSFMEEFLIEMTVFGMIVGLWSVRFSGSIFRLGIALIVIAVMSNFAINLIEKTEFEIIQLIFLLFYCFILLKPTSEQALFSDEITTNNIIGSICIFLLLGFIWAIFYLLVIEVTPLSFSGIELTTWKENLPDVMYFSFVTLTTLGYGDILPISPLARFFVYIEAIVGVFYMAIVVSSLVSAKGSSKI